MLLIHRRGDQYYDVGGFCISVIVINGVRAVGVPKQVVLFIITCRINAKSLGIWSFNGFF